MMEQQKKTGEKAVVSKVLFDDVCEVIHDIVPIEKVEKMVSVNRINMAGNLSLLGPI